MIKQPSKKTPQRERSRSGQTQDQATALTIANNIAERYGATIELSMDLQGNQTLNFTGNRPGTTQDLAHDIADSLERYSI